MPRVEFKGAVYHVIKRCNNRDYIFRDREDKESFLKCLEDANEEGAFNLLGYVIMDNHYHLIIETKEKPLHKIMQKVNNTYSKNYTKRHKRTDHVFGGRYKAILVNDDKYLFTLLRYIHDNPVRTKMHGKHLVCDLAEGCADLNCLTTGVHIYNLGTGQGTRVLELVKSVEAANGIKTPCEIIDRRPGDIAVC